MDNLSERAVLVSLEISSWNGRKIDKNITADVINQPSAMPESGSFSKKLISKSAFSKITSINNEIRSYYKTNTLSWENGVRRLLPSTKITEFTAKMREFETRLEEAVEEFIQSYQYHIMEAQANLNGMFDQNDYPSEADVRAKFGMKFDFHNIDSPNDFRCKIDDNIKSQIQEKMKESLNEKYSTSINRLLKKIYNVVKTFNEKLSDMDSVFRNSLVDNIENLISIIPDLNFMNDPKIAAISEQIQNDICRFDPEILRKDKSARQEAVKASADILLTMGEIYA